MIRAEVEKLEKVIGQLEGLHREITLLAKKSPTDGLNTFKLKVLNAAIADANGILAVNYKPIDEFDQFEVDDVPSNSDATIVLRAYLEELERYRADNIVHKSHLVWNYELDDGERIRTAPPRKIKGN